MDLLSVEPVSCCETIGTSPRVERVNDITDEVLQVRTTVSVINTEPKVSCVCGECVRISYRLYPELPAPYQSVLVKQKFDSRERF